MIDILNIIRPKTVDGVLKQFLTAIDDLNELKNQYDERIRGNEALISEVTDENIVLSTERTRAKDIVNKLSALVE